VKNLTASTCFLFDNGSFRPESTLALRRVAARLAEQIGHTVVPTSLLHSGRVKAEDLNGEPAQLLEPALEQFAANGGQSAVVLPLFFGPSGAMRDYLPPRLNALRERFSACEIRLAGSLESPLDDSAEVIAQAMAEEVNRTIEQARFEKPDVIATDHGSPLPAVAEVRNRIGQKLGDQHQSTWGRVSVSSMERREGAEYAFNDPLLEDALKTCAGRGSREIVIALQFLFPGRHAGPGGDIASISDTFIAETPGARVEMTRPIGESDQILQLLERRFRETVSSSS